MTREKTTTPDPAELRRRAEERLRETADVAQLSEPDLRKLLHELQVHQVELEMQGEELRAARAQAEAGLARYTELFDFAPIGYAALFTDESPEDRQELGGVGGRTRLQSPDFAEAKDRYELDIAGGASDLVVEESA